MIMSTTNKIVQERNFQMMELLSGPMYVSESLDYCVEENDRALYEVDFLN